MQEEMVDEVLFDEDEAAGGASSGGHSKMGTEESTSVSTNGEDRDEAKAKWSGTSHR